MMFPEGFSESAEIDINQQFVFEKMIEAGTPLETPSTVDSSLAITESPIDSTIGEIWLTEEASDLVLWSDADYTFQPFINIHLHRSEDVEDGVHTATSILETIELYEEKNSKKARFTSYKVSSNLPPESFKYELDISEYAGKSEEEFLKGIRTHRIRARLEATQNGEVVFTQARFEAAMPILKKVLGFE